MKSNKILKFNDYDLKISLVDDFINNINPTINESKSDYKEIQDKVINDLKLNLQLVTSYGAGIGAFYPVVDSLMRNFGSIEVSIEGVVLATICATTIIYLEEKKVNKSLLEKDSKSMLEELKMMGIGNGIIKEIIKSFKSILSVFQLIGKHAGAVVGGFMDMFAYTSILIPIMNGILYIVGKYNMDFAALTQNFIGLTMGIVTLISKHGIVNILDRMKSKDINKEKIIHEIETSIIQKFGDIKNNLPSGTEMIKERK